MILVVTGILGRGTTQEITLNQGRIVIHVPSTGGHYFLSRNMGILGGWFCLGSHDFLRKESTGVILTTYDTWDDPPSRPCPFTHPPTEDPRKFPGLPLSKSHIPTSEPSRRFMQGQRATRKFRGNNFGKTNAKGLTFCGLHLNL